MVLVLFAMLIVSDLLNVSQCRHMLQNVHPQSGGKEYSWDDAVCTLHALLVGNNAVFATCFTQLSLYFLMPQPVMLTYPSFQSLSS